MTSGTLAQPLRGSSLSLPPTRAEACTSVGESCASVHESGIHLLACHATQEAPDAAARHSQDAGLRRYGRELCSAPRLDEAPLSGAESRGLLGLGQAPPGSGPDCATANMQGQSGMWLPDQDTIKLIEAPLRIGGCTRHPGEAHQGSPGGGPVVCEEPNRHRIDTMHAGKI